MHLYTAPVVTLVARPAFTEPPHISVQWRGEASDGERLAEFAGRLCYMSQHNPAGRSTAEYLENIKRQRHGIIVSCLLGLCGHHTPQRITRPQTLGAPPTASATSSLPPLSHSRTNCAACVRAPAAARMPLR